MEQAGARAMQVGRARGAQRGVEGDALARCDVLLLFPFLQMETLHRGKRKGIKKADRGGRAFVSNRDERGVAEEGL